MENLTQAQLNEMIDDFKSGVIKEAESEGRTLQMHLAMGASDVLAAFVTYQERVIPSAKERGLNAPTLSELFGFDIKLVSEDEK